MHDEILNYYCFLLLSLPQSRKDESSNFCAHLSDLLHNTSALLLALYLNNCIRRHIPYQLILLLSNNKKEQEEAKNRQKRGWMEREEAKLSVLAEFKK